MTAKSAAPTTKKRLAVVEDDVDISYALGFNLEKTGLYAVERFSSGEAALAALETGRFDLAIVDLSLPDLDGLTLCRELRNFEATRRLPILFLTARVTERDRVRGFDAGADDYVTKPFSMAEVVARVGAHLRRAAFTGEAGERYEDDRLVVDRAEHRVTTGGAEVRLTRKELDLLWLLISSRPRVLSREAILERLWDDEAEVDARTIDVHVRALRRKLGTDAVETVVGVGYRFRPASG